MMDLFQGHVARFGGPSHCYTKEGMDSMMDHAMPCHALAFDAHSLLWKTEADSAQWVMGLGAIVVTCPCFSLVVAVC